MSYSVFLLTNFPQSIFPEQPKRVMLLRYKPLSKKKKTPKTKSNWNNPKYWTLAKKCWRLMDCNDAVLSFHLDDRATSAVLQEKLVKAQLFLPVVALGINIYMQGIWQCCDEIFPRWVSAYLSPVLSKTSAAFLCCVDLTLPCIIKPAEEDKQDKTHTFPYKKVCWSCWTNELFIKKRDNAYENALGPCLVSHRTIEIVFS